MKSRGFTLVEVMVALAIVAIALPALLMALNQQVDDTAYLRDKTLAQVVAANKLAEMRLVINATRSLQAGKSNGVSTLLDRDWHWWVQTLPTGMENFFRVEISVALDPERQDRPLYLLTAFMNSDLAIDSDPLEEEGEETTAVRGRMTPATTPVMAQSRGRRTRRPAKETATRARRYWSD